MAVYRSANGTMCATDDVDPKCGRCHYGSSKRAEALGREGMGTEHDNWLNQGSDGPKELDEDVFSCSLDTVADEWAATARLGDDFGLIYAALPAIQHAISNTEFPPHLRPYIVALANLSADIRAKVDDEYEIRTRVYDDPRGE